MDDRNLHIPLDFGSRVQFRTLEGRVGKEKATAALLILFRALGYAAQDAGLKVGYLDAGQVELLKADLHGICTFEQLEGSLLDVVEEGTWYCKLFAANEHLAADFVSIQKRGGLARSAKLKREQAAVDATKQAMLLPADLFLRVAADGEGGLRPEDRNRALLCVKLFDNVLGRPDRTNADFSDGLISDAARVARKFNDEEIEKVSAYFLSRRGRTLPRTEEVLRDFELHHKAANN